MNIFSFKYRNVVLGVTATAIGYYAILLPHTIFLNKYKYLVARYQIGEEIPLNSKMQQTIQNVMDDLKLPDNVRNVIKPFSAFGLDLFHAGTLKSKYGAILGIPANFTNTAEYLHNHLQVKDESIDWTQQNTKPLLSASILSESAQKFGIAQQLLHIQAGEPYFNSNALALTIAVLWTFYNAIVYKLKLHERNIIFCRIFYSVLTVFGAVLWFGIKDYRSYRLDIKHDETLCSLGAEYIKGGQEFYEKMLIRNMAIRFLLGKEGTKIYTVHGNEYTLLRQRHIPISQRKLFFDLRLQNLNCKV